MTDALDQTEHAAAELLAHGFDQKFQAGGPATLVTAPPVGGVAVSLHTNGNPSTSLTHLSLPAINTTLRPSGGSLPTQTISSPRSRNNNSLRPRGTRGGMLSPSAAAAAATGTASTSLGGIHPVVRLGWKSLCSVVCNGLRGEFLGGHDRDMFMKVTSGHYAGLPLVDVSLGGCIMTCSQFERYAGRELSKKWKESIHVVGEGEGSRATLLSWLKRKAEQDFGTAVIGRKIWVCWIADAEYYQGTIISYNKEGGKHTVQYSSRLSEDLHLAVELISFDAEKPTVPLATATGAAAVGVVAVEGNTTTTSGQQRSPAVSAPAGGGVEQLTKSAVGNETEGAVALLIPTTGAPTANNNNNPISFNPLWHQGSGISVTSSYGDELRGNAALLAMASGIARNRRSSGGKLVGSDGEGNGPSPSPRRARRKSSLYIKEDDIAMPPPKRALSAPAAVLLAEAAAAAAAIAAEEQLQQQQQQTPGQYNVSASPGLLPMSPVSLCLPSSLMLPLPPPPVGALTTLASADITAATGATATTTEALTAAVGWMHDVALCLDTELEDTERLSKAAATTPAATPSLSFISPSGRFQALLGLLRATPACVFGVFESMVRRYNHFASNPQVQRQKLVELMLATLIEAAAPRDLFKSVESAAATAAVAAGEKGEEDKNGAAAAEGQTTTSPSPSLLNNAKNNNQNTIDFLL